MLDKLFKKKSVSTPKSNSKSEDDKTSKPSAKKDKSVLSGKAVKAALESRPPSSGIPRGGGLSSRSRTPSRESLAKCRIQPPASKTSNGFTSNRLSSDSGIHSPAELKSESSGLVRNNSLPSARVHSVKDSAITRQTALRASTNSPVSNKKDSQLHKSLPKALTSLTGNKSESKSNISSSQEANLQLKIPPPLPSSLPPPSSNHHQQQQVYNQLAGVSHYTKPSSATKSHTTDYQNKDNINEARKLQQQRTNSQPKVKVECDTQTDSSALLKIASTNNVSTVCPGL